MRAILFSLTFLLFVNIAAAQKELLSFDGQNKYIYYQVEDMPGLAADSLFSRGLSFFKAEYPKVVLQSIAHSNKLKGNGKFVTYGGTSVLKHESGEIKYTLSIECKDNKYRYWLNGFVFTPYRRDRYGNFIPKAGVDIPLESVSTLVDENEINKYLSETGLFCKQFGDKLKQYMAKAHELNKNEITKKVITEKW